jgi:hypothetical protein
LVNEVEKGLNFLFGKASDAERAATASPRDGDGQAIALFQTLPLRRQLSGPPWRTTLDLLFLYGPLQLSDGPVPVPAESGQMKALAVVVEAQEGSPVTFRQVTRGQKASDLGGELKETKLVRHRRAVPAEATGHLLLGETDGSDEGLQGLGDLKGRQVLTLEIFHQGDLEELVVIYVDDTDRHRLEAGQFRRLPPSFAGDDLMTSLDDTNKKGLKNAVLPQGKGEAFQAFGQELPSGLTGIGPQRLQRKLIRPGPLLTDRSPRQEGTEAAA